MAAAANAYMDGQEHIDTINSPAQEELTPHLYSKQQTSGEYVLPSHNEQTFGSSHHASSLHSTPLKPFQGKISNFNSFSPAPKLLSKLNPAQRLMMSNKEVSRPVQTKLYIVPHSRTLKNYQVFRVLEGVASKQKLK